MQPHDIEIFEAWKHGESFGSIAKRYNVDKQKIKGIVNRVGHESWKRGTPLVHELPDETAPS
jgi:Mor family transcriptional regulator